MAAVTVAEASDPYANFMINPAPLGPGVCSTCRGFPNPGYGRCHGCSFNPSLLDAFVPITYSVHLEQMHTELRGYKEDDYPEATRSRSTLGLAAVLWRFLDMHEPCVARTTDVAAFDHVVTVPSNTTTRDNRPGGLRAVVSEICGHTRDRYVRALVPTDRGSSGRNFDADRFIATLRLDGSSVLLIDDTWTSGAKAQSAAHALRQAGAKKVACVVLGRHVHRGFAATGEVLAAQPAFSWNTCSVH
jgi:predicted amidophosphoribosyltransferase